MNEVVIMLQQYDILMIYNVYMNNSNCRTPMIVIKRLCNGYEYSGITVMLVYTPLHNKS